MMSTENTYLPCTLPKTSNSKDINLFSADMPVANWMLEQKMTQNYCLMTQWNKWCEWHQLRKFPLDVTKIQLEAEKNSHGYDTLGFDIVCETI
jgi:hypothetical protein